MTAVPQGIKAQDLSRGVIGSGDGGSCSYPKTEEAMHHRQKFREACKVMGWYEAHPYKGAGRLVVETASGPRPVSAGDVVHLRPDQDRDGVRGLG